jgi:hypothetical protein
MFNSFFGNSSLSFETISETQLKVYYVDHEGHKYVGVVQRQPTELEVLRDKVRKLESQLTTEQVSDTEENTNDSV